MKIKFQGQIGNITKNDVNLLTNIVLDLKGAVDGELHPLTAKPAKLEGTLSLKPVVANQLKIGTKVNITIEEVEDGENDKS